MDTGTRYRSKIAIKQHRWQCPQCTLENLGTAKRCRGYLCLSMRPLYKEDLVPMMSQPDKEQFWESLLRLMRTRLVLIMKMGTAEELDRSQSAPSKQSDVLSLELLYKTTTSDDATLCTKQRYFICGYLRDCETMIRKTIPMQLFILCLCMVQGHNVDEPREEIEKLKQMEQYLIGSATVDSGTGSRMSGTIRKPNGSPF